MKHAVIKLKQPFYGSGDNKAQISTRAMDTSHKIPSPKTRGPEKAPAWGLYPEASFPHNSPPTFDPATYDDG